MPDVVLRNIVKKFDGAEEPTIRDLNLTIPSGEFVCLLGPSGCGKTTTLRMIAGLEHPTAGSVSYGDKTFSDSSAGVFLPAEKRDLGMMFQSYALWPHMTVGDNIEFGLKMKKMAKPQRDARIAEMEILFRLEGLLKRYPSELSGGQQQRVALARMLAVNPSLLLLDEPLSNLDAALRLEMRAELKRLHKALDCTIVFVTHDQFEAMSLATSIVVMADGDIMQMSAPLDVYHNPQDQFVAQFVGNPPLNIFSPNDHGTIAQWAIAESTAVPGAHAYGIRPEALSIHTSAAPGRLEGVIDSIQPNGADCITTVVVDDLMLFVLSTDMPAAPEGAPVWLGIGTRGVHSFSEKGVALEPAGAHG
ncbi:MAG: ABC transporter ATP-binding protein [Propionicimonas sp.]